MTFGEALIFIAIDSGNRIRRDAWPEGQNIQVDQGKFLLSINDHRGKEVDWIETVDITADDWEITTG